MQYVNLGSTGLKVSRLCLGTMTYGSSKWRPWVLDEEASRPLIKQALEAGINFFDTADMYSLGASEQVLGRALKDLGPGRDRIVIATKVFYPVGNDPNQRGLSRKHIMHAIDDSLRRLGTDYVDLYQIHRFDAETPIEETLQALHDVVRAGKARYLGASSMSAWQFAKMLYTAEAHGWTRFVTMQNHYNLMYREEEREMMPLCQEEKIGVLPWSPLARGLLAGKQRAETVRAATDTYSHQLYGEQIREADARVVDRLEAVAAELGVAPAQVALAWLLHKPGVVAPIIGVSKPGQLDDALRAPELKLTADLMAKLEEPYLPHAIAGM
ncbi:MAG: 1-deoxyxylulose-5-phosphate synthase [Caballeronia sp.]|jgi:aryl-alcohol dehydrogenase (NADP+)|nr:1-deoxyxylulose-5-phosphate synthase [Caballeronia sp.]